MLFPNPTSSRVLVRKTLAAIVGEVGHIFAGEVEAFLLEEARTRGTGTGDEKEQPSSGTQNASIKEKMVRKIGRRVVAVAVSFFRAWMMCNDRRSNGTCLDKAAVYIPLIDNGKI
jgi:hypothetical protein